MSSTTENKQAIASPEELSEYIHVTTPSIWLVLIAITILVAGSLVWASKAHLKTTANGYAVVENNVAVVYFDHKYSSDLSEGMEVSVNGIAYNIQSIEPDSYIADDNTSTSTLLAREFGNNAKVCTAVITCNQPDGVYPVEATVEVITPISFLFNKRR